MHLITDLGDAALLLPASGLLLAYLLYARSERAAAIWASTLALSLGLTLLLKIGFHACGAEIPLVALRSPSGHTSFSTTFYSCAAMMISVDRERWTRLTLLLAAGLLVSAIAASRIVLHAHTPGEVVLGLLIGALSVAWFAFRYFERPVASFPWWPLLAAVIGIAILMHGRHFGVEGLITDLAQLLRLDMGICR